MTLSEAKALTVTKITRGCDPKREPRPGCESDEVPAETIAGQGTAAIQGKRLMNSVANAGETYASAGGSSASNAPISSRILYVRSASEASTTLMANPTWTIT